MKPAQPSTDGAEVVAALAKRLETDLGSSAVVDLHHYEVGFIAEFSVTPQNPNALKIAVIGLSNEFIVNVGPSKSRRAEISNTSAAEAELNSLISDALEGKAWSKRAKHAPYR